jgi:predicted transcriptional regulator YheO
MLLPSIKPTILHCVANFRVLRFHFYPISVPDENEVKFYLSFFIFIRNTTCRIVAIIVINLDLQVL